MARLAALVVTLLLAFAAGAQVAQPAAADPAIEKRATRLYSELRCLVCQNQTIAESNAPLALDLREQVREKVKQGHSDEEIVDYLVARYGDFVRYRPPLKLTTVLLWFGPLVLMIGGVLVLLRRLRAKSPQARAPLTDAERSRVAALLADRDEAR
jgi:cytochrome c-type biogenesis protein CcmH